MNLPRHRHIKEETELGASEGQAVPATLETVTQLQASVVANEVTNAVFVNNIVLSVTSDSGVYDTGFVNHSVTCIL